MATEVKPNTRARRRENIGPYHVEAEGQPKAPYGSQHEANDQGYVRTYEAGRILDIGEGKRQPGELVPEAHTWFRLQDLLHTGYLISVEVTARTFAQAVNKYCQELKDELKNFVNVDLEKK
jgi:hypothetical protein